MPPPTTTQNRLDNVVICLNMTTNSLQIIADSMKTLFLGAIINTTQAVLKISRLLANTKMTVFSFWSKSTNCRMQS
ncbi:hypothetical protein B0H14DRAFT_3174242 [Mycena olivaceomarginata]|nr:hypothetical protein B0H14DRAFT_3174242 [Mycena olivaceomarginata]